MAQYFAELDKEKRVVRVIVLHDSVAPTEEKGVAFCVGLLGGGPWKQTYPSGGKRVFYAGAGATYEDVLDAFVPVGYVADVENRKLIPPPRKDINGNAVISVPVDVPLPEVDGGAVDPLMP